MVKRTVSEKAGLSDEERKKSLHEAILKAFNEVPKYEGFTTKDLERLEKKGDSMNEFAELHGGLVSHTEANGGTDHYRDGTVVSAKGIGIRSSDGKIIWTGFGDIAKKRKELLKKRS